MSTSVSNNFVVQYQAEVHTAYQQNGSRLRNTVRLKTGVTGMEVKYPQIGKGEANQKSARHADITPMSIDHNEVTCVLSDWYAADYIDALDEYKLSYDERQAIIMAGAYAVGRKVDSLLISAATAAGLPTAHVVGAGADPLGLDMVMNAYATINAADVPDDGMRYCIVGPHQWNQLLRIRQFASSDYAGDLFPWLKGTEAKRWLNTTWMMHNGLPSTLATVGDETSRFTTCLWYHKSALGIAENSTGIISEINYVPQKAAWLANNMIGAGACRIDNSGVVLMNAKNTGFAIDPEFSVTVS